MNQSPLPPPSAPSWRLPVLLALATLVCHGRAVWHDLVDYDTQSFLFRTDIEFGLTPTNFIWAFGTGTPGGWSPLTWLSHMTMITLFGDHAGAHHLLNVLLHVSNVILLYILIDRMTGKRRCAALIALLLAIHPLHVEAVAWVAELSVVLAMFFALWALIAYARYAAQPRFSRYIIVLVLFALALLSKPMVVTLPAVMMLMDYWPLRRTPWLRSSDDAPAPPLSRILLEKLPMAPMMVASCVLTVLVQRDYHGLTPFEQFPLGQRVENSIVAYVDYLAMIANPARLACFYPIDADLPAWRIAGSAVILIAATAVVVRRRKDMPWLLVGWLWFVGTFVPMIGIIHTGLQALADRYMYLPGIGIYMMLVFSVDRWVRQGRVGPGPVKIVSAAVLLVLFTLSFVQVGYWRDTLTLFARALAVTENNYVAHNNIGIGLLNRAAPGDMDAAYDHFLEAIRINPDYIVAETNLAALMIHMKRYDQAIALYERLLVEHPNLSETLIELAAALAQKGDHAGAVARYRDAIDRDLDMAPVHYRLALSLLELGDRAAAQAALMRSAELGPTASRVWLALGELHQENGNLPEAAACYRRVIALEPVHVAARWRLGQVSLILGDVNEAEAQLIQAVRLDADHIEAHYHLGMVHAARGRLPKAIASYERALQLRPDWARAHNDLGVALARSGRREEAARHFEKAVSLDPDFEDAKVNLMKARE